MPQSLQRANAGQGAPGAGASDATAWPTPALPDVHKPHPEPPSTTSTSPATEQHRASPRSKHTPLLALAPSVIPDLDAQHEEDISVIWNVISRAADVVKDGERLENLAWRHWGAPSSRRRRSSSATAVTESSAEIGTPSDRSHAASIPRNRSFERRSFTGALKLLVEESSFKDWVGDARKRHGSPAPQTTSPTITTAVDPQSAVTTTPSTPSLAPPDTPVANLEIRLVEPTPVPSRVGSLGGSVGTSTVVSPIAKPNLVPENINEVASEAEASAAPATAEPADPAAAGASAAAPQARNRRANNTNNNRFFIQSSPGKVSGSSSSQPSSIPRVVPPEQESHAASHGSHFRSSGESSSAIVIKKKERRHVSMANMRGRFAGEKARAAQAIAARNQPKDDSDEWEDETGEDDGEEEDCEGGEGEDDDDDDDEWEDEPSTVLEKPPIVPLGRHGSRGHHVPPPAPTPPKTKKERAAEKARLEAERDASRKREMFAKQQIFNAPPVSEGLLTRTFRTGKSMVDLTQAGREDTPEPGLRRAPTAAQLTTLSSSPGPSLLRSKSTAAMPVQSGVSVTSHSHVSGGSEERGGGGGGRLAGPQGLEMETSDEESDDDDYLQSEEVQAKLNALAAKRAERERTKTMPQPVSVLAPGELDPNGVVRPMSPTSRRRAIIMREMSESLRKNIIVEREKSSGRPPHMAGPHKRPPPSVHPSRLPTSSSALNLAQYHAAHGGEPLKRQMSNQLHELKRSQLERHSSHPNLTTMHSERPTSPSPQHNASASVSPEHRRRPNVLGSGFLRPLTRVEGTIGRTHSVAALSGMTVTSPTSDRGGPSPNSHSSGASGASGGSGRLHHLQAAPMQRSSTEGVKESERARLRRELAKRGEHTDTSYRYHGW